MGGATAIASLSTPVDDEMETPVPEHDVSRCTESPTAVSPEVHSRSPRSGQDQEAASAPAAADKGKKRPAN